jgi:hypothetical protein
MRSRFGVTPQVGENSIISPGILSNRETMQQLSEFRFEVGSVPAEDDPIAHKLNSFNYRSPEFGKVELLTAGCSQTFGMGVEEEHIWPTLLSNKLNMTYANLGNPGASPQLIVENIIKFISDYGKPKAVCVVFPSLYRFRFVLRHDILVSGDQYQDNSTATHAGNLTMLFKGTLLETRPKFSKLPHEIIEVLPYEAALYLSLTSIKHLIEYCKIGEIPLFMSSWYPSTEEIFLKKKELSLSTPEYLSFDLADDFYEDPRRINYCHSNTHNLEFWDKGLDVAMHMGAHQHIHFAELFNDAIENKYNKDALK